MSNKGSFWWNIRWMYSPTKVDHVANRLVQGPFSLRVKRKGVENFCHLTKAPLPVVERCPNRVIAKAYNVRAPITCQVD